MDFMFFVIVMFACMASTATNSWLQFILAKVPAGMERDHAQGAGRYGEQPEADERCDTFTRYQVLVSFSLKSFLEEGL